MTITKKQKMLLDCLLSYAIRLKEQKKTSEDVYKAYQAAQIDVGATEQRVITAQKDLLDTFLNDHVNETILTGNEAYPVCVIEKYNKSIKVTFPVTTKLEVSNG